eukprot:167606-Rhodomonas_salina.3
MSMIFPQQHGLDYQHPSAAASRLDLIWESRSTTVLSMCSGVSLVSCLSSNLPDRGTRARHCSDSETRNDLHALAFCGSCFMGRYLDGVGSSGSCVACPAGSYSPVAGAMNASTCLGCPANTDAFPGSTNITDCICNAGYTGAAGASCMACKAGTYKGVNGTGVCLHCSEGRYQNTTAASMCEDCPANTDSPMGSIHLSECICENGYEGTDGTACSACLAGKYKSVN